MRIFTIGHEPFDTVDGLVERLIPRVITVLIDVRSHAYSDTFPRFNQPLLEAALNRECIYYQYLGDVFTETLQVPSPKEIAKSQDFAKAIAQIIETAQRQRVVLLGSSADPLQCRRAILFCQALCHLDSEHLNIDGEANLDLADFDTDFDIRHIHSDGSLESHRHLEDRLLLSLGLADPFLLAGESQMSLLNPSVTAVEMRSQKLAEAYPIQRRTISQFERGSFNQ